MLTDEFYKMIKAGKRVVVRVTKETVDYNEESLDPLMMGAVIGAYQEFDDSYGFNIDLNDFEGHNRSVALRDWFDKNNNPTLSWFDSGLYPKDGIVKLYFPVGIELPIEIVEENGLFSEYIEQKTDLSYLQWLEQEVLKLRKNNF